jgi:multidrug efflux pump subunit AcrA (membrane-fusion protein)
MGVKVAFRETVSDEPDAQPPQSLVPSPAIRDEGGQQVVFVLDGELVDRRAVSTGRALEAEIEIMAGVRPGEKVVVTAPDDLEDGQKVRVRG